VPRRGIGNGPRGFSGFGLGFVDYAVMFRDLGSSGVR
jgi:hypothetical protein